jgi:hypothetical protein
VPGEGSTFFFSITATPAPFVPVSPSAALSSPRWLTGSTNIYIFESCEPSSEVRGRKGNEEREEERREREYETHFLLFFLGTKKTTSRQGICCNPNDFRKCLSEFRWNQKTCCHTRVHEHPHLLQP